MGFLLLQTARSVHSFLSFVLPTLQIKYECCGKVDVCIRVAFMCSIVYAVCHMCVCITRIVCAYEFAVLNYIVCLWSFAVKMCNFCAMLQRRSRETCRERESERGTHCVYVHIFGMYVGESLFCRHQKAWHQHKNSFNNLNVVVYGITCGYMLSFALLNEMIYGNCQLNFIKRRANSISNSVW